MRSDSGVDVCTLAVRPAKATETLLGCFKAGSGQRKAVAAGLGSEADVRLLTSSPRNESYKVWDVNKQGALHLAAWSLGHHSVGDGLFRESSSCLQIAFSKTSKGRHNPEPGVGGSSVSLFRKPKPSCENDEPFPRLGVAGVADPSKGFLCARAPVGLAHALTSFNSPDTSETGAIIPMTQMH